MSENIPVEETETSVVDILDELIEIVTNARSAMMSASVKVNRTQVLDMLTQARDMLPDQLLHADKLLRDAHSMTDDAQSQAESIRQRAHEEAETIIQEAREQASRLVSQDAVTISAKAEASRIVDEARSQAEKLHAGANAYSDQVLSDLGDRVAHVQETFVQLSDDLQKQFESAANDLHDYVDSTLQQIDAGREVIAEREEEGGEE